ncbi:MAG: hypothetical protein EXR71_04280 [Myxococcales bacterium]|nr:hypothetical protein [Myxococcales bacterium]
MPDITSSFEQMSGLAIARRLLVATAVIMAGIGLLGLWLRAPLEAAAMAFVAERGLWGVGLIVLVGDPFPGLGFQPGLLVGIAAGVPTLSLYIVTALCSTLASMLGWLLGRAGRGFRPLRRVLHASGTSAALDRWGIRAVLLGAVLPLPFGLATIGAGVHGLPFALFVAASAARWVKIAVLLGAFSLGWSWGDD